MKAIIEGLTYNTETATELGRYSSLARWESNYVDEGLYRTKKGRYFLAGEGGALSRYGRHGRVGGWCEGEKIIPITEDEAREWMERHCDAEEYIAAFGEPEEA